MCSRITADINNALRIRKLDGINYFRIHSGTWRIGNNHIWFAMFSDKLLCQNFFHITSVECTVINIIDFYIFVGRIYSILYIFYTYHMLGLMRYKLRNCSGSGVQIAQLRSLTYSSRLFSEMLMRDWFWLL